MAMLLTLTVRSLSSLLGKPGQKNRLTMNEVPRFVLERLGLRGLVVDTSLLKGWSVEQIDQLRISADQAGCPCLLLRESNPVAVVNPRLAAAAPIFERVELVAMAAHRLGCNAMSLKLQPIRDQTSLDFAAMLLRQIMERIDRMELNLLLEPAEGLLSQPGTLIDLVKKVGGFRIGTLPSFEMAQKTGNCVDALRQTAPYASAVLASWPLGDEGSDADDEIEDLLDELIDDEDEDLMPPANQPPANRRSAPVAEARPAPVSSDNSKEQDDQSDDDGDANEPEIASVAKGKSSSKAGKAPRAVAAAEEDTDSADAADSKSKPSSSKKKKPSKSLVSADSKKKSGKSSKSADSTSTKTSKKTKKTTTKKSSKKKSTSIPPKPRKSKSKSQEEESQEDAELNDDALIDEIDEANQTDSDSSQDTESLNDSSDHHDDDEGANEETDDDGDDPDGKASAAGSDAKFDLLRRVMESAAAVGERKHVAGMSSESGQKLMTCVKTLQSVGYEQILAIDFIGEGDPVRKINRARRIIETMLEAV